ncbi:MAG: hypothetical protein IPM42_00160 [Saprospiraceae bacterium]|nr:hypothetical protein [Saprospiraceae bacterium]
MSISLSIVKDVNPSLVEKINKDLALCFKPRRWNQYEKTHWLDKCYDDRWCLKNDGPLQDVHDWSLIEIKNIGTNKIILLGSSGGDIFSSWYFFNNNNEILIDNFSDQYINKDPRMHVSNQPCPIHLLPQQNYFIIHTAPHPLQSRSCIYQFMYYRPDKDSVYRYWLVLPEMKITENSLELVEKYKGKVTPERYTAFYGINPSLLY